jgi:hypothetical protein
MADTTPRRIRVVDRERAPVPGALVSVSAGTAPVPEIALVTDAAGVVVFPLPEGRFRIAAHASDGRSGQAEIDTAKPGGQEVLIELAPQ